MLTTRIIGRVLGVASAAALLSLAPREAFAQG
jgi:hypothetical protein